MAALSVAAVVLAVSGADAAVAVVAGGAISVINSLYFARRVFAGGVVPAQTVLRRFYIAEAVKIAFTVALFLVALVVLKLPFLPLLLGYGVTLLVYWVALLMPPAPAHR